jgi:hypothetical protein
MRAPLLPRGHSAKVSPIKGDEDEIACIIFRFTYLRWTGQTKMMLFLLPSACVCTLHIPAGLLFCSLFISATAAGGTDGVQQLAALIENVSSG